MLEFFISASVPLHFLISLQVERFVFRPGLADKARYYAVVFLIQVGNALSGCLLSSFRMLSQ